MLDQAAPPERLEQGVAEPQRHQILHGLLAEVMIDAVNLLFGEGRADLCIDQIGGSHVVAERLFEDHPGLSRDHPGLGEVVAHHGEQIRGRREEEDAHDLVAAFERRVNWT